MQSFIIASKNNDKALEEIRLICLKQKIDQFDLVIESFEKTVGIEEVRNFTKKLFLKPFRGDSKALVINSVFGLTTESQNALLKILEEPPKNTLIFLVVEDINILLPTILSRCKVIKIEEKAGAIDANETQEFQKILENLNQKDEGFKLKLAQDFGKSREEATTWLEKAIVISREIMLKKVSSGNKSFEIAKTIEKLENGRSVVKTSNVNPRLILENTLLSLQT